MALQAVFPTRSSYLKRRRYAAISMERVYKLEAASPVVYLVELKSLRQARFAHP